MNDAIKQRRATLLQRFDVEITRQQVIKFLRRRWKLPASQHGIDFLALREMVSIGQVLELVGWIPVARNGPQARGPCPIHKSSREHSRSFSVNLEKNLFQCFGCGEEGNQLDLWMAVTGLTVYDAARDLANRLHLDPRLISQRAKS